MEDLELRKPQTFGTSTQIALLWACARAPALDELGSERLCCMAVEVAGPLCVWEPKPLASTLERLLELQQPLNITKPYSHDSRL